ncbi:chromosomal replication initiator protein DnaA [bacterium]|nr:chromosomal replication initiator protein DnaA [bacterium]MBU1153520.1 chromosomal replication initiator protein DnaA [bacterium]MBU1782154.1 chromosomal replication initiator protein DnaA [bacterium]
MDEKLWHEVLSSIKKKVSQRSFNLWFGQTKLKSISDKKVEIEVPNNFIRDKIEKEYKEELLQTLVNISNNKDLKLISITVSKYENVPSLSEDRLPDKINKENKNLLTHIDLNPYYTFENFITGESNRFACAAALAVSESPASAYNPLFIYGGVGLGKTHLIQAIGHRILKLHPNKKIVYTSSERFTNEFIESIRYDKSIFSFKNKYRTTDVLLIDDIQFLAGKDNTKEEFFHTFNTLYESHRQIIITSDKPPRELPTIEERLRSRFESGLTTDIQTPSIEVRIAILKKKIEEKKINLSDEIVNYIAFKVSKNIRELIGALNKVSASYILNNQDQDIDLNFAKKILKDSFMEDKLESITIEQIQNKIVKHFSLHLADMKTKKKNNAIALPRQIAMYLCRELTDLSLAEIGASFGGRDHSTVIHAYEKIKEKIEKIESFGKIIEEIKDTL